MPRKSSINRPPAQNRKRSAKPSELQPSRKTLITDSKSGIISSPVQWNTSGDVLVLGQGDTGQLGLGEDIMERKRPALLPLPDDVKGNIVQVVAGGMHTAILTKDGKVFTFGCNDEGALGRSGSEFDPLPVVLDCSCVMLSAGDSHSAALSKDGQVWAWGTFRDSSGHIGLVEDRPLCKENSPLKMNVKEKIVKIESGSDHLTLLTETGKLLTAGNAEQGQLGRVARMFSNRGGRKGLGYLLQPQEVHFPRITGCPKSPVITDVWCGTFCTFARSSNETIFCWGLNNYGQIGVKTRDVIATPQIASAFPSSHSWKQFSSAQHHTLALNNKGDVYCLGRGEYGRLGLGKKHREDADVIKKVPISECSHVSCSACVSFALSGSKKPTFYSWGMGTSYQLGSGEDDEDVWEPCIVKGKNLDKKLAVSMSVGGQHSVLLVATE